ncbi:phosphoribosylformylglycinamidine synthase subunit PurS [Pontibacillus yanchengensis]|uniref:Phosphoribosylformylglycinamidine synthase subunit PurS n=2 Tax=Pontibacillus yanchengensis TaxID=462910 RepID=A0ACC7VLG3_9BACI|nr:phosphoribosylformylglycinamidine synthase subunit PurS [Pontibacillus yanchengensis]MYL36093.1 phosphoribosylformylglycinamidine synthase subunit PurS [Pontibacillus yanchengensis]MYL55552.1 phosphoribosylformylglycinamidine synthase subunit PurS [Pontibacillus yanchengensis]
MYKVKVYVTLKEGVLDPQGKAIQQSLRSLSYQEVEEVRVGKYIELFVEQHEQLEERINKMCDELLANPVIEEYQYEIEEAVR